MTKLIRLKISRIKYSGDSIGDDIRIEAECLDKFVGLNMRLKRGGERVLDAEIGQFFADSASFALPLSIKIVERDLIFNDVGATQEKLKVNLNDRAPQVSTYQVEVRELRNFTSRKRAVFAVTVEATVLDAVLYVSLEQTKNGWVWARKEETSTLIDLPAYLRVRLERQDGTRQYFTIMEGPWQGTKASVELQKDGTSYLNPTNHHTGPAHLLYSLSQNTLKFKSKTYTVREYKNDPQPWKKTRYDIEIPDYYHKGGRAYLDRARLAPVWFKTTYPSGNRYVHAGTYSLGCVTLTEVKRWDELCETLMRARKDDGKSVGTLEVVD